MVLSYVYWISVLSTWLSSVRSERGSHEGLLFRRKDKNKLPNIEIENTNLCGETQATEEEIVHLAKVNVGLIFL